MCIDRNNALRRADMDLRLRTKHFERIIRVMKAIITVLGKDQVGIMFQVSKVLNDHHVNIEDVTQTIMQDYFTMLMLVKLDESESNFQEVRQSLHDLGQRNGLSIHIQKEEIFDTMHKI